MLLYLNDVEGGSTAFPLAVPALEARPEYPLNSKNNSQVQARMGNAVIWRNCINSTVIPGSSKRIQCVERDWRSLHMGVCVCGFCV